MTAAAPSGDIRTALRHDSAHKHVTGDAVYVDDIRVPDDTLVVLIGQSPHAHARILDIDLSRVARSQGVVAVLTHADIPGRNDCSPVYGDDPILAETVVSYVGQAVFAVVAETMRAARDALAHAVVTYEPLSAVLTIDQAMREGSWLGPSATMESGTPDAAIAAAPLRLSGRIEIGGQEHFYLEGQAALAIPGEDRDVTLYCSTQHPSEIQHKAAECLGLASHAVTVETRRMGGAFGGKESQGNLPALLAALAAHRTGRPAKTVYDRDDDFMLTGKRHDFRIDYDVGFDAEGRIEAVLFEQALRCGMSWDLSEAIAARAMCHADNAYHIPHVRVVSHRCRTNTQSNTAFRGFGGPQGMIGIERVIDQVAHHLGLDPLVVRQRNFYAHKFAAAAAKGRTPYGQTVEDCILQDIVPKLADSADYAARRVEIDGFNRDGGMIRRGIALTPVKFGISFNTTFLNQAGALVHVYGDGSVHLNHGGTEMGQGLNTKVAQIVAHEFQVGFETVKITATTTGKVPNTSATAASSGTDLNGMAAQAAARTIKGRMRAHLAELHQCNPDSVTFTNGRVRAGAAEMSFAEAAKTCYLGRVSLSSTGFYATPKIHWDKARSRGRPFYYYAYGAAVSEVAVDLLTGENRILRTDILHDAGRSLNPAIDTGQIEGGFVQGAGWLTTEELVWDGAGRLRTHAPSTYKIPACADRPPVFNVALFEDGENIEDTIHKSKAVGEPPLMLGISVLMALSHALESVGDAYPMLDAPATPERLCLAARRLGGPGVRLGDG
ncbi:MAG: xanthine dehydrogenase molybdopterin binding subunit [Pseudomonadota bacterium]|nr:xanthine dehydrogenase molybdopterin binding subunit [Pseudomonadota bacterium]MEC8309902.1 xanthine dehydrogenase molybdopterin binding subunit [Pseudomonadota bacterium]MEC8515066.1 xanthine dehydrogenase molybdopterin binding subunit [Pseudomonadota bacterium]MEC8807089.1 xanthine dehydrogenase molybdopterin binding subunit [Pseudomonadota bacterium]MEC9145848.1 xanthine dehydrogenase molybdopterin binding subunit [Pseudomonadota bacterium]